MASQVVLLPRAPTELQFQACVLWVETQVTNNPLLACLFRWAKTGGHGGSITLGSEAALAARFQADARVRCRHTSETPADVMKADVTMIRMDSDNTLFTFIQAALDPVAWSFLIVPLEEVHSGVALWRAVFTATRPAPSVHLAKTITDVLVACAAVAHDSGQLRNSAARLQIDARNMDIKKYAENPSAFIAVLLLSMYPAATPAEHAMRSTVLAGALVDGKLPDLTFIEGALAEIAATKIQVAVPVPQARFSLPSEGVPVERPWWGEVPPGSYLDNGFLRCAACKGRSGLSHAARCKAKAGGPASGGRAGGRGKKGKGGTAHLALTMAPSLSGTGLPPPSGDPAGAQQQAMHSSGAIFAGGVGGGFPSFGSMGARGGEFGSMGARGGEFGERVFTRKEVDDIVHIAVNSPPASGSRSLFSMNALSQCPPASPLCLPSLAHLMSSNMLDGGCSHTCGGHLPMHNPVPAPSMRIQCGTGFARDVTTGSYVLRTSSDRGDETIVFKNALSSPDLDPSVVLISQDQLLQMHYRVSFPSESQAVIFTPSGGRIDMHKCNGVWFFPPPRSRSHMVSATSLPCSNRFSPLANLPDASEAAAFPTRSGAVFNPQLSTPQPVPVQGVSLGSPMQPHVLFFPSPNLVSQAPSQPLAEVLGVQGGAAPPSARELDDGDPPDDRFTSVSPLVLPVHAVPVQSSPLPAPIDISLADQSDPRIIRVQTLHARLGCPGHNIMGDHIRRMSSSDPDRPSWKAYLRWKKLPKCLQCLENSKLPAKSRAHPPASCSPEFAPGEFWIIDGSGKYGFPTLGGSTQHFLFADFGSKARLAFPTMTKSSSSLIGILDQLQIDGHCRIRKLQGDHDVLASAEMQAWARVRSVVLSPSPPYTPQPNGAAETLVQISERSARAYKTRSGCGTKLWPWMIMEACRQFNTRPHTSLEGKSSLEVWPDLPYQHAALLPHVFGCRMHNLERDRTDRSSAAGRKSRPLIYLGVSRMCRAYLGFDPDTDAVLTVGADFARFDDQVFPLKDMMLQGEAYASDRAIDTDGWRCVACCSPATTPPGQLAEFLTGKAVVFRLPPDYFPMLTGSDKGVWEVRALRPQVARDGQVSLVVQFEQYHGVHNRLPLSMRSYKTTPFTSHIVIDSSTSRRRYSVRGMITVCYPSARLLSDVAAQSVAITGSLPSHSAVDNDPDVRVAFARTHTYLPTITAQAIAQLTDFQALTAQAISVMDARSAASPGAKLGFCPSTRRQALAHDSWPLWAAAEQKELQGLASRQVYDRVSVSSLPEFTNILGSKYEYTDKSSGTKARCVARGDMQKPYPERAEVHGPTPGADLLRILLAHTAQTGRRLCKLDATQAFTQSDELTGPPIYMRPPPGAESDRDIVWRLRRPLYGLAVAPRYWNRTLVAFLRSQGWVPVVPGEDCLYRLDVEGSTLFLVYHVDDIMLSYLPEDLHLVGRFKQAYLSRFAGTDDGDVTSFVGLEVDAQVGRVSISLSGMISDLLEEYQLLDCNPVSTPLEAHTHLLFADQPLVPLPKARIRDYQHLVGSIQYIACWTRPDLAFVARELGQHCSNPGLIHEQAARRVLRYLKGTMDLALVYTRSPVDPLRLVAMADADWAGNPESRKSISADVSFLSGGAVAWSSKRQGGVATSSTAAEYTAASQCGNNVVWQRRVCEGLGFPQSGPTPIFEDNRGCRMLSETALTKKRTRHIDIAACNIRDLVEKAVCRLVDCPTHDMHADPLTKALPGPALARHRSVLLGADSRTTPPVTFVSRLRFLCKS